MAKEKEKLSPVEQEHLEIQLASTFDEVVSISEEMEKAREKGNEAKQKAEAVKTGFWKSNTKAIEELKGATEGNIDTTLAALDIVDKVSENQKKMTEACNQFIQLGAVDMASNRAVIAFIEKTMGEGADKTLSEETVSQLRGVIQELKQKQDLLVRQKKQGEKINEHDKRLEAGEKHDKQQDEQLQSLEKKNIEQDERLEKGDQTDKNQDKRLDAGEKRDIEHDKRLDAGDKKDSEQDERLDASEKRDQEQDAALEDQRKIDLRHDEQLAAHEKELSELDERIRVLEKDVEFIKNSKKMQIYIAISAGIGIIGIILGILGIIF